MRRSIKIIDKQKCSHALQEQNRTSMENLFSTEKRKKSYFKALWIKDLPLKKTQKTMEHKFKIM